MSVALERQLLLVANDTGLVRALHRNFETTAHLHDQ